MRYGWRCIAPPIRLDRAAQAKARRRGCGGGLSRSCDYLNFSTVVSRKPFNRCWVMMVFSSSILLSFILVFVFIWFFSANSTFGREIDFRAIFLLFGIKIPQGTN